MQYLKLTLEYDGGEFHGWQAQPGQRTVQGELQEKLALMLGEEVKLVVAGRTDAGVHARGQVAHCHVHNRLAPDKLLRGLNSLLPSDVAVRSIQPVRADFHARYSASRKLYSYAVVTQPTPSPLLRRCAHHMRAALNVEAMRQAASLLIGQHDFSAFWGGGNDGRNPWRTLCRLDVEEQSPMVRFRVEADSFLRHMVRNLVGTLLEIGRGRFPADWAGQVLRSCDRCRGGPTAPAHGLCLEQVMYAESFAAVDEPVRLTADPYVA